LGFEHGLVEREIMDQSTLKKELRDRYRRERVQRFIPSNFNVILNCPEIFSASTICSYFSFAQEPSTTEINQRLIKDGKRLLLPRVSGNEIEWVHWDGDSTQLKITKKLTEPIGPAVTDLSNVGAVITPALRIDQEGFRLGQGGGFYDRALPKLPGWTIGLVHPGELSSESVPREVHDIPLNAAATPSLVVRFNR
jgi:5-formyltetrahydrofolate cyclo-ligase